MPEQTQEFKTFFFKKFTIELIKNSRKSKSSFREKTLREKIREKIKNKIKMQNAG